MICKIGYFGYHLDTMLTSLYDMMWNHIWWVYVFGTQVVRLKSKMGLKSYFHYGVCLQPCKTWKPNCLSKRLWKHVKDMFVQPSYNDSLRVSLCLDAIMQYNEIHLLPLLHCPSLRKTTFLLIKRPLFFLSSTS